MSLKSFFSKPKKYNTQDDIKDMTAEQIVMLEPSDVNSNIETAKSEVKLTGVKQAALRRLLAIKRTEKESGVNPRARQRVIDDFLKREGLRDDPQVTKLLVDTNTEIMRARVTRKQLQNRLNKLSDKPEIPYTDEEELFIRMSNLKIGGKTRRNRRHRTKKRKSHKKRRTYRRK